MKTSAAEIRMTFPDHVTISQNGGKKCTCGHCLSRRALRMRQWRERNPETVKIHKRRHYEKHSERIKEQTRAYSRSRYAKGLERQRKYGITPAEFDRLLLEQGRACALCKMTSPGKRGWQVDHDHKTGRIRGLLCRLCNVGLGHFRDDAELMRRAADYVSS